MRVVIYQFADGTKNIIEVEDKWADMIEKEDRLAANIERKERYWNPFSIDEAKYEGEWFEDHSKLEQAYDIEESQRRVDEFKKLLTITQLKRLEMREENPNISLREIARKEGVAIKAIEDTFEQIKKKYKKFQKNTSQNRIYISI